MPGSPASTRLAVAMNVTLTPLDLAMAEPHVRRQRSILLALLRPRVSLASHPSAAAAETPALTANRKACAAMCAAVAAVERSGGPHDAGQTSDRHCEESCLRGSHADPHMKAFGQEPGAPGRKVRADLPWFPRRASVLQGGPPYVKHLSWVTHCFFWPVLLHGGLRVAGMVLASKRTQQRQPRPRARLRDRGAGDSAREEAGGGPGGRRVGRPPRPRASLLVVASRKSFLCKDEPRAGASAS